MDNICWLKITDYMHGWARKTLGGTRMIKNQPMLSVRHLDGVPDVLMMGVDDELPDGGKPGNAMSATWRNALEAGIVIDPAAMESEFGATREVLEQYMPIACPVNAVSKDGVIRPWTEDTCFGKQQAIALQRLIREEFWKAVGEYSKEYARKHRGEKYAQADMIEAFCKEYRTDDIYVEAIRREWLRRLKNKQKK